MNSYKPVSYGQIVIRCPLHGPEDDPCEDCLRIRDDLFPEMQEEADEEE